MHNRCVLKQVVKVTKSRTTTNIFLFINSFSQKLLLTSSFKMLNFALGLMICYAVALPSDTGEFWQSKPLKNLLRSSNSTVVLTTVSPVKYINLHFYSTEIDPSCSQAPIKTRSYAFDTCITATGKLVTIANLFLITF